MKKLKILIGASFVGILSLISANKISKDEGFQFFGELVSDVETSKKVVALTFDDGPTVGKTEEILKILEENNVKATFYLVGQEMSQNFNQAKLIVEQGHEVGNHSYTHQKMIFTSYGFVQNELSKTDDLIRQAGFEGEITFRPPYGRKLFVLPYYLMSQNIKTITWNVEPDSVLPLDSTPDALAEYTLENVTPGSIILMHVMYNSRKNSMAAVPEIITSLKREGYSFVTVSELIGSSGA